MGKRKLAPYILYSERKPSSLKVDYLHCEHCRKPVASADLVAVPRGNGEFEFGHRDACADAIHQKIQTYQLTIEDTVT